jgi:hypothetical protein
MPKVQLLDCLLVWKLALALLGLPRVRLFELRRENLLELLLGMPKVQLLDCLLLVGRKLVLALLGLPRVRLLEPLLVPASFH